MYQIILMPTSEFRKNYRTWQSNWLKLLFTILNMLYWNFAKQTLLNICLKNALINEKKAKFIWLVVTF